MESQLDQCANCGRYGWHTTERCPERPKPKEAVEAEWVRLIGAQIVPPGGLPELGESRIYAVRATCTEVRRKRHIDGDQQIIAVMRVEYLNEQADIPKGDCEARRALEAPW
jgi:hypothetical protein